MPDLEKFGIRVAPAAEPDFEAPISGEPLEVSAADVDDDVLQMRVIAPATEVVSVPIPVKAAPSTGDPLLDFVLRHRSEARSRLRVLRKELMQEQRKLADISAFVRPRMAADTESVIEEGSMEAK